MSYLFLIRFQLNSNFPLYVNTYKDKSIVTAILHELFLIIILVLSRIPIAFKIIINNLRDVIGINKEVKYKLFVKWLKKNLVKDFTLFNALEMKKGIEKKMRFTVSET